VRLLIVSPDSTGTACPLSGRNSTYRPVQISGAGSDRALNSSNRKVWVDLAQRWLDLAADIEAVEEGGIPSAPVH
jgi:hypothetical protein